VTHKPGRLAAAAGRGFGVAGQHEGGRSNGGIGCQAAESGGEAAAGFAARREALALNSARNLFVPVTVRSVLTFSQE
jgi:hypothetical protein